MNETRLQELEKALQEPGEPRLSREFVQEMVDEIRNLRARVYLRDLDIRDLTKRLGRVPVPPQPPVSRPGFFG